MPEPKQHTRYIGIDVGRKRIGLARTDLLRIGANPIGTYSQETIWDAIADQVADGKVSLFVVGWPLLPNGDEGKSTEMVQAFINRLKKLHPDIPIAKVDERYTSQKARNYLIEAGVPKKQREQKERIDQAAAAVILQYYLETEDSI
ncbi:MAG: Holliday junction resolvase RuvX [Bacteroidota bacterium]